MAAGTAAVTEAGTGAGVRPRLTAALGGPRLGLWLILAMLLLWEVSARSGLVVSSNWPPVSRIVVALVKGLASGELIGPLAGTLYRALVGLVAGAAAAVVSGLLISASPFLRRTLEPTLELLRPLPVPALIPPLILFVGLDDEMKICVVAFTAFFPVFVNTVQGASSVEPTYRAVAQTFNRSRAATLMGVVLPATVPYIFAGLRLSIGLALVSGVAAEMIAGDAGIGYYLTSMQYAGDGPDMFAALFLLGFVGYLVNRGFVAVERRVLFWYRAAD